MKSLRLSSCVRTAAFAITLATCLGARSAYAQAGAGPGNNYYPSLTSPIDGNAALTLIEAKLSQVVRTSGPKTAPVYQTPSLIAPVLTGTPPPPGGPFVPTSYVLANEVELNTVLGQAVTDMLSSAPGAYTGSVEDLVRTVATYRNLTVGKFVAGATQSVLTYYTANPNDAERVAKLEEITRGATAASPAQAGAIVAAMLKLVTPVVKPPLLTPTYVADADNIVEVAISQAAVNTEVIVKTALTAVKTVNDVTVGANTSKQLIKDIAAEGLNSAFQSGIGVDYLVPKIAATIGATVKGATKKVGTATVAIATSAELVDAIFTVDSGNLNDSYTISRDLTAHPEDIRNVALVAAGLMKGFSGSLIDGGDPSTNIVTAVRTALHLNDSGLESAKSYIDSVKGGFTDATTGVKVAQAVADAVVAGTNSSNKDFIAARAIGASAWLEAAAPLFIGGLLEKRATLGGAESISDIVGATVRATPANNAKVVLNAATWTTTTASSEAEKLGKILQGSVQALKGQPLYNTMVSASIASILKVKPLQFATTKPPTLLDASKSEVAELAQYGMVSAESVGSPNAIGLIAQVLQKAAAKDASGFQNIMKGAIGPATGLTGTYVSAGEQWRVIVGAMSADKVNASAIRTWSTNASNLANYDGGQNDNAVTAGGDVVIALQLTPKETFTKMYQAFAAGTVPTTEKSALAVLTGASLIAPANAAPAAALAIKLTDASVTALRDAAGSLSPALKANINITIDVAAHVKAGTGDLFDYLEQQMFQYPKLVTDIVTGATIVSPNYGHIVAHAVGYRSPSSVAKAVPLLFNYAHITSNDPTKTAALRSEYDNLVDATSAMTAAITAGIIEARTNTITKTTNEVTFLKTAVTALMKQAATLTGNTPIGSLNLPDRTNPGSYIQGEGTSGFKQSDGSTPVVDISGNITGGFTSTTQSGAGGVITGFITKALNAADVTTAGGRLPGMAAGTVGAVITAAVGVVKTNTPLVLAIAQAASQAAKSIASDFTGNGVDDGSAIDGEDDIIAAIMAAFKGTEKNFVGLRPMVANAVHFGYLAAQKSLPGAGAAGVLNYTQNAASGAPVTDIFEL